MNVVNLSPLLFDFFGDCSLAYSPKLKCCAIGTGCVREINEPKTQVCVCVCISEIACLYVCFACGRNDNVTRLRVCIYRLPAKLPSGLLPPSTPSPPPLADGAPASSSTTYSNYCAPPHMCVFVVRFRAGWYACSHTDSRPASRVFVCIRVPYMPRPIVSASGSSGI